jgi:hypothetical protein
MARRLALALVAILALALLAAAAVAWRHTRDRHPGATLDLHVTAGAPAPLRAGFAAVDVTPPVPDAWTDTDGDARRDEDEPWQDGNGNGRFDGVWMAGFHAPRPAAGVHDPLWARAVVLDDGTTRLALVVLDAIGLLHDQVLEARARVAPGLGVDHVVIATTHTHQGPDLMGLWGPGFGRTGVDPAVMDATLGGVTRAVAEAVAALRPARLRFAEVPDAAARLVEDSRPPEVLDPGLRLVHAVDAERGTSLGVLVGWANHPETLWDRNLLLSSDFPHFLREALEEGVRDAEGRVLLPGLGGTAVYANGAIGGLMTTRPGFAVRDPFTGEVFEAPTFAKARAQGRALAKLGLEALRDDGAIAVEAGAIGLRTLQVELPLANRLLWLGAALGVLPRGFVRTGVLRTEVGAFTLGPASFLLVPGEIYPEIVNGGIETPPGADFPVAPVEVPPLRGAMPGRLRFVIGQANDALGYVIPKSEWDAEAPWIYGAEEETYGEIVSVGPETAPRLHAALLAALRDLEGPRPAAARHEEESP